MTEEELLTLPKICSGPVRLTELEALTASDSGIFAGDDTVAGGG